MCPDQRFAFYILYQHLPQIVNRNNVNTIFACCEWELVTMMLKKLPQSRCSVRVRAFRMLCHFPRNSDNEKRKHSFCFECRREKRIIKCSIVVCRPPSASVMRFRCICLQSETLCMRVQLRFQLPHSLSSAFTSKSPAISKIVRHFEIHQSSADFRKIISAAQRLNFVATTLLFLLSNFTWLLVNCWLLYTSHKMRALFTR